VLTIRYNIQDAYLVRYFEPIVHSSVFIFFFGTAVIATTLGFMNPTIHSTCYIVPYPLSCAEFDSIPCERGANYKQAGLWIALVPSCISVAVILICLSLVGYTVWQQQRVVRQQQMRLPSAAPVATPTLLPSSAPQPRVPVDASIIGFHDNDPHSALNLNTPAAGDRSLNTACGVAELRRRKSGGAETILSPFCCTVANSVIWLSVVMGFFVTGRYSQDDRYWVR
jgi:hypothetical protein